MNVQPFAFPREFAGPETHSANPRGPQTLEREVARLSLALETEVLKAKADAYGEALEQLRADRDTALLSAVDAMQASLEALDKRFADIEARLVREGAEMAFAAAEHLAGKAISREPEAVVAGALARALEQAGRARPIEVRVHPDLVTRIEAMVAERQSGDRRKLSVFVHADLDLPLGDARLAWDDSSLNLDAAARRDTLRSEVEQLFPAA